MMTIEEKATRKLERQQAKKEAKEIARIAAEKAQKPVKKITISIEWKKSATWGANPHCTASVHFKDGSYEDSPVYKASGCGYDKESTVIADVFNAYLKYKLWEKPEVDEKAPYGLYLRGRGDNRYVSYNGGVGTNCYYNIAEYIGGKFTRVATGKTYDAYTYTETV
jgi:phenylpyruvate tautomerase PptA (4-oxalocrotonate tautomerase family)